MFRKGEIGVWERALLSFKIPKDPQIAPRHMFLHISKIFHKNHLFVHQVYDCNWFEKAVKTTPSLRWLKKKKHQNCDTSLVHILSWKYKKCTTEISFVSVCDSTNSLVSFCEERKLFCISRMVKQCGFDEFLFGLVHQNSLLFHCAAHWTAIHWTDVALLVP